MAKTFEEMLDIVRTKNMTIVDAREKNEFDQGHIPNAINVPFSSLFESESDLLKPEMELWKSFIKLILKFFFKLFLK